MDRYKPSFFAFLNRDKKNAFVFWLLTITVILSAIFVFKDENWEGPAAILAIAGLAQAINLFLEYRKYKQVYR